MNCRVGQVVRFYGRVSYSFYLLHMIGVSLAVRTIGERPWPSPTADRVFSRNHSGDYNTFSLAFLEISRGAVRHHWQTRQ